MGGGGAVLEEGEIEKRCRVEKLEGRTSKNRNLLFELFCYIEVQFSVRECEGYI